VKFDFDLVGVKYSLIACFLFEADTNILDISYSVEDRNLTLQVVLLAGFTLPKERMDSVKGKLTDFNIELRELHLTRDQFNENKGAWRPTHYEWLDHLLFTKAET